MEVLNAEQMRRADREAIEIMQIPGLVLMENAGLRAAEVIDEAIEGLTERRIWVLAGTGNNGGDGFVVARHLDRLGAACEVVLVGATRDQLRGDAAAMCAAWTGMGGTLLEIPDQAAWKFRAPALMAGDVVIDGLFGTGLNRPLEGFMAEVVQSINHAEMLGAIVVALDLPSGLFGGSPLVPGPAVQADLTVTFARPKLAHLLPPAEDLCGEVVVVDIGIPARAIQAGNPDLQWVTLEEVSELVPERDPGDHKGTFGHALVVAGSIGKAGAAALTGWGALRAGAGLVTLATPAPVRPEVAGFAPELMTENLPSSREGQLAKGAAAMVLKLAKGRSVMALGPGLGQSSATQQEIRTVVAKAEIPVVLDADGLNAFAGKLKLLARRKCPLIVTPHPGEAARLCGVETAEVQADRVGFARRIAATSGAVCVLKGYRTIVAEPEGQAFINPTGNPGMGSGGTGDALTGIIAGLLAQGLEPIEGAILGTYLHGLAADLALEAGETEQTLTASHILDSLPDAFDALNPDLEEVEEEE